MLETIGSGHEKDMVVVCSNAVHLLKELAHDLLRQLIASSTE
jgi:hypothetical protein